MQTKIDNAKTLIAAAMDAGRRPAVLSSFGKDSMALLHLVRETVPRDVWSAHAFPLPVVYFRDPWFAHKHVFAEEIARSWAMEIHHFLPVAAGVKCNSERLELVARYSLGIDYLDLPRNVCAPEDYPRRDYLCGLRDWILRPKAGLGSIPFDMLLHGHKSADIDDYEGAVPLRSNREKINDAIEIVFPLRDWTDSDVWNYLERHKVPFQKQRYGDRRTELADKWHNNDYTHACTRCIDPRNPEEKVMCPKLKSFVPNVGARVARFEGVPDYIEREENNHAI